MAEHCYWIQWSPNSYLRTFVLLFIVFEIADHWCRMVGRDLALLCLGWVFPSSFDMWSLFACSSNNRGSISYVVPLWISLNSNFKGSMPYPRINLLIEILLFLYSPALCLINVQFSVGRCWIRCYLLLLVDVKSLCDFGLVMQKSLPLCAFSIAILCAFSTSFSIRAI